MNRINAQFITKQTNKQTFKCVAGSETALSRTGTCLSPLPTRPLYPESPAPTQDGRGQQLQENNVLAVNAKRTACLGFIQTLKVGRGHARVSVIDSTDFS